jgi:MFS superfamily sulfate permease-like transporter
MATAASMFLVILAQSAATSRAYAVKYQEHFVENDDLVGLSAANLAAGFSGTFAVNGSPTKTEMVDEAKSRTQVAQLTTALVVVIVLLFLTKPLQYLPNAVLSAVVFLIGLKLIDLAGMHRIWRLRPGEFWVATLTAAFVVGVGVEQGIILAIVLSIILHLKRHYTPRNRVLTWDESGGTVMQLPTPGTVSEPGLIVYVFDVGVFYANAERLSDEIIGLVDVPDPPRWFVLDAIAIDDVDYTGGMTLAEVADQLARRNVVFVVAAASDHLQRELGRFGVTDKLGGQRYYDTVEEARNAFRPA